MSSPKSSLWLEAENLAEVTAVFLKRGFMVYRPEADVDGIDFLVSNEKGGLLKCQLKGRPLIQQEKYGGKDIWMVFPGKGNTLERDWYAIPHDVLYRYWKPKHGEAPNWNHPKFGEYWHKPVSAQMARDLSAYKLNSEDSAAMQAPNFVEELPPDLDDIDPRTDAGWTRMHEIGLAIDGYSFFPYDSGLEFMSALYEKWQSGATPSNNLFILRILLFYQLRMMYHAGQATELDLDRCVRLLGHIRSVLSSRMSGNDAKLRSLHNHRI